MGFFEAIFLGIVQGLTELLPISSSAHLTVLPWLMWNVEDIGAFDVALHAGTLLAIGIFFFKDWINLLVGAYKNVVKKEKTFEGKMFWYIVLATIPGGLIGFVLDDKLDLFLETRGIKVVVSVIAFALMIMGVILYFVDKKAKSEVEYKDMTLKQTFLIGFSQALAFIPGVSRSGITMTCARALHINRSEAARFSMLLSIPTIGLGALYILGQSILNHTTHQLISIDLLLGIVLSALFGLFAVWFLMRWIKTASFTIFALYRIALGLFLIYYFL